MAILSAHGSGAVNRGPNPKPGSSNKGPWWAIIFDPLGSDSSFSVMQGTRQQATAAAQLAVNGQVLGPYQSQDQANAAGNALISKQNSKKPKNIQTWFEQATGGVLAAALEQGFIQILKDIWTVIQGPVMILAGALIIIATLAIYFKNDIGAVAGVAAMAA